MAKGRCSPHYRCIALGAGSAHELLANGARADSRHRPLDQNSRKRHRLLDPEHSQAGAYPAHVARGQIQKRRSIRSSCVSAMCFRGVVKLGAQLNLALTGFAWVNVGFVLIWLYAVSRLSREHRRMGF